MAEPAIAFNGPRTMVSKPLLMVGVDDKRFPLLEPVVPIGEPCVPLALFYAAVLPHLSADEIAEMAKKHNRVMAEHGVPHCQLQVLITADYGCVETMTASAAAALIDTAQSADHAAAFRALVAEATENGNLADPDQKPALFESLTALHRCLPADKRRNRGPAHWYRWRGKAFDDALSKGKKRRASKGIWKAADGQWMGDHRLALDYAGWLFPRFLIWTFELIGMGKLMGMMEQTLGVQFVTVPEAKPEPHLKLVSDNGEPPKDPPPVPPGPRSPPRSAA